MEKYTPNRVRFFMRKKYKTFSTVRIVALRSVNKIFQENYDFAATQNQTFPLDFISRDKKLHQTWYVVYRPIKSPLTGLYVLLFLDGIIFCMYYSPFAKYFDTY
jgi:hypothetical protein